jgi:hypothetical protein
MNTIEDFGQDSTTARKSFLRRTATAVPTVISVLAFGFSTVSYYETAMKHADLAVFVPPVIHYARDAGGDIELFAIPITITNDGARTGTVLSMDLEVERLGTTDKETPARKRYYSAYLGEHPRSTDAINSAFSPASIAGRQTYSQTVRFYPAGNPLPRLVQEKGEYRFTLRLNLAETAQTNWWDKMWAAKVEPVAFTLTIPWISDQHLNFRRGSLAMHAKDHRPTSAGSR